MSIIFDNFVISALGNASLAVVNNKLEVTNMGNTGLDGFQIETPNSAVHVHFDNINFGVNGSIRNCILVKRGLNIYTSAQENTFKDSLTNKINFAYDFNYVSDVFEVWGKKNGIEVFSIEKSNPVVGNTPLPPGGGGGGPQIAWGAVAAIATVVLAAVAVYEVLKPSKEWKCVSIDYYPNGHVRRENWAYVNDPTPIDVEVDGQIYNVDEWGIRYEKNYEDEDNIQGFQYIANQFTCSGINNLTIESIASV